MKLSNIQEDSPYDKLEDNDQFSNDEDDMTVDQANELLVDVEEELLSAGFEVWQIGLGQSRYAIGSCRLEVDNPIGDNMIIIVSNDSEMLEVEMGTKEGRRWSCVADLTNIVDCIENFIEELENEGL